MATILTIKANIVYRSVQLDTTANKIRSKTIHLYVYPVLQTVRVAIIQLYACHVKALYYFSLQILPAFNLAPILIITRQMNVCLAMLHVKLAQTLHSV